MVLCWMQRYRLTMATLLGNHFHIMVNNLKQYFNASANMETEDRFHIFIVKQYILKKFLA